LFLSGPGDEVGTKEDAIASGGAAILRVASPIGVTEAVEGEGAFGIMEAKIEGAFEVTKNSFSCCPVHGVRRLLRVSKAHGLLHISLMTCPIST